MKVYVDSIPTSPEGCMFAREVITKSGINITTGKKYREIEYYCNIDFKPCKLNCGDNCNNLRLP